MDEVHATRESIESKGEFITKILQKRGFKKDDALMVGDHYELDYMSAINVNVDAVLIESDYMERIIKKKNLKKTIRKLSEILAYL